MHISRQTSSQGDILSCQSETCVSHLVMSVVPSRYWAPESSRKRDSLPSTKAVSAFTLKSVL